MAYIGQAPANKPVEGSDISSTVITGQTALSTAPADTDEFLISDGGVLKRLDASLIGGGGKILQVVSATDTTSRSTTSTSFVTASNTLTVDITPSATSSKILLLLQANIHHGTGTGHCVYITLFKGGTNLNTTNASAGFSAVGVYTPGNTAGYIFAPSDIKYIDSPSTTSQITYDCRFRVESSSYTGKLNHTGANAAVSSLIAMEIGA